MIDRVELHDTVDRLYDASPDCCNRPDLDPIVTDSARLRAWLDAIDTAVARRAGELERAGRSESAAEVLSNRGRRSSVETRAASRRAAVTDELSAFADALADGEVSAGHLDAVARATAGLSPAAKAGFQARSGELVAAAKAMGVDEFAAECRHTARDCSDDDGLSELERQRAQRTISRRVDDDTGMVITRLALDPVTGERFWNAIERIVKPKLLDPHAPSGLRWDHVAVDTVVDLVTRPHRATTAVPATRPVGSDPADAVEAAATLFANADDADAGDAAEAATLFPTDDEGDASDDGAGVEVDAVPSDPCAIDDGAVVTATAPDVVVLIDAEALLAAAAAHGVTAETAGGHALPVSTVRRLCCEARIFPLVLGSVGEVLDHGHGTRLATPAQRRALAAMYTHCAYPGCKVRFEHCQIHHVIDWSRHRGRTDLANLLPLCCKHHHLVHEGRWQLELRADRTITLTRPDGAIHFEGSSINRRRRRPPPPHAA